MYNEISHMFHVSTSLRAETNICEIKLNDALSAEVYEVSFSNQSDKI